MGDVCETDGKPIQKGPAGRHTQGKKHITPLRSKLKCGLGHDMRLVGLAGSSDVPDSWRDVPEPYVQ